MLIFVSLDLPNTCSLVLSQFVQLNIIIMQDQAGLAVIKQQH